MSSSSVSVTTLRHNTPRVPPTPRVMSCLFNLNLFLCLYYKYFKIHNFATEKFELRNVPQISTLNLWAFALRSASQERKLLSKSRCTSSYSISRQPVPRLRSNYTFAILLFINFCCCCCCWELTPTKANKQMTNIKFINCATSTLRFAHRHTL